MSGTTRPSTYLGSFVVGEVPPPLEYQFLDADGAAINLTGFTVVRFQWAALIQGQFVDPVVETTGSVSDAVTGRVTYPWDGDEFDAPGEYAGIFYVNNGTVQYASILVTWQVCLSIGTPPAV
jgi:hypothetical protein